MSRIWIVPAFAVLTAIPTLVLFAVRGPIALEDDLIGGVAGVAFTAARSSRAPRSARSSSRARAATSSAGSLSRWRSGTASRSWRYAYATYGLSHGSPLPPGTRWAAWYGLGEVTAPLIGLALFYFPDGRLPSPRWRPAAVVMWTPVVLLGIGISLAAGPARTRPSRCSTTRSGFAAARDVFLAIDRMGWFITVFGIALATWAAPRRALRRATGTERRAAQARPHRRRARGGDHRRGDAHVVHLALGPPAGADGGGRLRVHAVRRGDRRRDAALPALRRRGRDPADARSTRR